MARRYLAAQRAWSYHLRKPRRGDEEHRRLWQEYKAAEAEFYSPAPPPEPVELPGPTRGLAESLFPSHLHGQVIALLESHCGRGVVHNRNTRLSEDERELIDQVQRSVLLECDGSLECLTELVDVAEEDYRYVPWWGDVLLTHDPPEHHTAEQRTEAP